MIKLRSVASIIVIYLLFQAGCSNNKEEDKTLLIYSGAGLKKVMGKIGDDYSKKTDTKIKFIYSGSGILINQIKMTKKGDLFIPGDSSFIDELKDIDGKNYIISEENVAYHKPVLVVSKFEKDKVKTFDDLGKDNINIALGDENTCIGKLSKKMINKTDLKEAINKNVKVTFGTVNQVALAVSLGEAEAGIAWYSNYVEYKDKLSLVEIPEEINIIEEISISVLELSEDKSEAVKFMEFVINNGVDEFKNNGYELIEKK
ncbi:MAG: molybdate ABC transporter substrate-binding protein [Clostridiales bacterium]